MIFEVYIYIEVHVYEVSGSQTKCEQPVLRDHFYVS